MSTSTRFFLVFFPFFLVRIERRRFQSGTRVDRSLLYSKIPFFFTCPPSRYDSYNVLLLFKTAINQHAFNYGDEEEEGGWGRRELERTPRLSRYSSRRLNV